MRRIRVRLVQAPGTKPLNTVPTSGRRLAEAQARAEQEEARASKLLKALVEKGDLTEEARQEAQEEIAAESKAGDAALLQHLIQKGVVSEESISEVENPTSGPTE
jgi:polyhydroxyalkanoate synthesis regulator phasin